MHDATLPALLAADPLVAAGVVVRMGSAVAAGGLPAFPRIDLRFRGAAALALAAVAVPAAVSAGDGLPILPVLAGEAVLGFGLGLALAIVFAAAAWAGGLLAAVSGAAGSEELAAAQAGEAGAGRLAAWLAVAGFLAADGHLALVSGLVDSVQRLPVGLLAAGGGRDALIELAAAAPQAALGLAMSLAAPALAAVLAFQLTGVLCLRAARLTPGPGLLQAAASIVLLAVVLAGAGAWTTGFATAVQRPLERGFLDPRP